MTRYFAQKWIREEFEYHKSQSSSLNHAVSALFRRRGMQVGDVLYIWACFGGHLRLVGRMKVDWLGSGQAAAREFGNPDFWEVGVDHALADNGMKMRFDMIVKPEMCRRLRFVGDNPRIKFRRNKPNEVEPMSLLQLRELTPTSARELDRLLGIK